VPEKSRSKRRLIKKRNQEGLSERREGVGVGKILKNDRNSGRKNQPKKKGLENSS